MDTTLQDPLVGRLLDERYLVESRIARGGMATVYLAVDRRLDREIALKIMHPHLADDDDFVARFVREARSAARLSHPNVVQVFDQGADGELLYLAMEHLPGRTLRDVLNERRVLTPREALTVIEPVLDALSAAHRAGIVHRDVKPENVILTDEGRVKVADFGLARAVSGGPTQTGALMGTVAYLSPELVARGVADARSDVYAAGIMLFEMLTGRQPFGGDVPLQIAYRHVHEDVPPPSSLVPALVTELDDVVLAAVARDPDERPADGGAWLRMVRRVHAGLTDEMLDSRPPLPAAMGAPTRPRPDGGSLTEVVVRPVQQYPTQALPALGSLRTMRERSRRESLEAHQGGRPATARRIALTPEDVELDALAERRRRRGQLGMASVLVFALLLGAAAWWFAAGPGAFTRTPHLTTLTAADAGQVLAKAGLRGTAQSEYSDTMPKDQIVRTDPDAGARVRNGGTVVYWVSLGPQKQTIPQVVGQRQDDATTALTSLGLKVTVKTQADDNIPAGQVISADPGQGQQVPGSSTVTLTVSQGQPIKNVVGWRKDDAVRALQGSGYQVDTSQEATSNDVAPGSVISQDPVDVAVSPNTTVKLVISTGGDAVQLPNLWGWRYVDAERLLKKQGLQVQRSDGFTGGMFKRVTNQDPGAGQTVPRGSTVTLTVS